MVKTPLEFDDKPDDYHGTCELCGKPLYITHHRLFDRWHATRAHERCIDERFSTTKPKKPRVVPARFGEFDPTKADKRAMGLCAGFSPESKVRTLAILGVPALGKSRLLWATAIQFFDDLGGTAWVDAFGFEKLVAELDRAALAKITNARYVLVDDIGCIESYGRERAALQAALRARIKGGKWTFLTVDNMDFDPGLEDVLKHHALVVAL